jgi:four helix bundle protein
MIKTYKDLDVWKLSFDLAMDIFWLTKKFPKEERYSLTSPVVRSSRSVSANITEGWAKRNYEKIFKQHLIDSLGSNIETYNWIDFAKSCEYISDDEYKKLTNKIDIISKMITKLHQNWTS